MRRNTFTFSGDNILELFDALMDGTLSDVENCCDRYNRNETRTEVKNSNKRYTRCSANPSEMAQSKLFDFIDRVIAQGSATVILWKDGTKTSVKCTANEPYDYEKGLALAVLKKVFGNGVYQNDMQKIMTTYPYVKNPTKKKNSKKKPSKETK